MQPHMRRHTRGGIDVSQTRSEALHHANCQDAINTNFASHSYPTVNAFFIHPNSDGMKTFGTQLWCRADINSAHLLTGIMGDHLQHKHNFQDPRSCFSSPPPPSILTHTLDWRSHSSYLNPWAFTFLPAEGPPVYTGFISNRCLYLFHNKSLQIYGAMETDTPGWKGKECDTVRNHVAA